MKQRDNYSAIEKQFSPMNYEGFIAAPLQINRKVQNEGDFRGIKNTLLALGPLSYRAPVLADQT